MNIFVTIFSVLLVINSNLLIINGATLPNTVDIQGSLQKDNINSRNPKFLFGVGYMYITFAYSNYKV